MAWLLVLASVALGEVGVVKMPRLTLWSATEVFLAFVVFVVACGVVWALSHGPKPSRACQARDAHAYYGVCDNTGVRQ